MAAPVFSAVGKNLIDPLVADAGPGGVVNADEIGLGFDPGQGSLDRVGPLRAAIDHIDAENGDICAELGSKILPIFRRNDQNGLHYVVPPQKTLGRMQPHGFVGHGHEGLFIVFILEPAAAPGGRQNYGEFGHDKIPSERRNWSEKDYCPVLAGVVKAKRMNY